jgi:hypothetical protein
VNSAPRCRDRADRTFYLREGFGRETFGRLMGFLFIWQFILSGPLEIASGYIGFTQYLGYIWKEMSRTQVLAVIAVLGVLNITLLYRRITFIGKLTVSLWVGTILTTLAVIVTGIFHFKPSVAFDFPPGAFNFSLGFFLGLGAATRIGISIISATTTSATSVTRLKSRDEPSLVP